MAKGIAAAWTRLRKKPCDACGIKFKPVRPNHRFCSTQCGSDWHHHGGAYVALKPFIEKQIVKRTRELTKELTERVAKLEAMIAARHVA